MPLISTIEPSIQIFDNRLGSGGSQQWSNLRSLIPADSKGPWGLAQKVGMCFLFVIGAWIFWRMSQFTPTVTLTGSEESNSHVHHRSTTTSVVNGTISFSNSSQPIAHIEDAGRPKQQEWRPGLFEKVVLNVPGKFTIVKGERTSLTLAADECIFNLLCFRVSAKILTVEAQPNSSFVTHHPIQYTLVVPNLKEIKVTTAAKVAIDCLEIPQFSCTVQDDGEVVVLGDGTVEEQKITVEGTGLYQASRVKAKQSTVFIKDVGKAHVQTLHHLDVEIKGKGTCFYYGTPSEPIAKRISKYGRLVHQIDIPEEM